MRALLLLLQLLVVVVVHRGVVVGQVLQQCVHGVVCVLLLVAAVRCFGG